MSTFMPTQESMQEQWYIIDAENQILGRLATRVAAVIQGKNQPDFTPHINPRNHVIVVNADKVRLTGKKLADKKYYRHSGYPGGIKEITAGKLMQKDARQVITFAVNGMLPKNRLGRAMQKNLRVYCGSEHKHLAQKPVELTIE
ncbi:50S ribosomal protein L13 [Candidatus Sumerlaeota bacterium]|nr:50S ribosomal protein L13 [Candidatus Sumerlaeota bacterium]